jgi:hypothetical protein
MFKWIDESTRISRLIENLSSLLARQRGLPVVIGIVLLILAFIAQAVEIYVPSQALELVGVILHYTGILIALIGSLLAEPLGK